MDEGKSTHVRGVNNARHLGKERENENAKIFDTLLRGQSQRPPDAGDLYQKRCSPPQSRGLGPLERFYLDGVTPLRVVPLATVGDWLPAVRP